MPKNKNKPRRESSEIKEKELQEYRKENNKLRRENSRLRKLIDRLPIVTVEDHEEESLAKKDNPETSMISLVEKCNSCGSKDLIKLKIGSKFLTGCKNCKNRKVG